MNRILSYIRRKLSVRVSLWVVIFAAIIFIAALSFLFYQSREAVRQEAVSRATQILDKTSLRVESILNRVLTLPPETVLYPGHGEVTTVGEEIHWYRE